MITRAVGTEPDVDVDVETIRAEPGDLFLLCSDGLTDMVSDGEILSLLAESDDLDAAARALAAANTRSPSCWSSSTEWTSHGRQSL